MSGKFKCLICIFVKSRKTFIKHESKESIINLQGSGHRKRRQNLNIFLVVGKMKDTKEKDGIEGPDISPGWREHGDVSRKPNGEMERDGRRFGYSQCVESSLGRDTETQ